MSSPFIKAEAPNKKALQVTYYREDGSSATLTKGTRTWRNQNPGNIVRGSFANDHGAIGDAGGFAVFPSYEVGRAATFSLMKTPKYQKRTVAATIEAYAPVKGGNNTARYQRLVQEWTGLDLNRRLQDLSTNELERLVNAIERMEGWELGQTIETPSVLKGKKITAVRKNKKGTITDYCVEGLGWVSKSNAIQLASQGKVDAVVATSRSGNLYLRTRPDVIVTNNFETMG